MSSLRIAIVGAGPAGFYTAEALLRQTHPVIIDMFEKLPAPFGLVRYGVAPDHQKIKNVIKIFEKIASDEKFFYFGNVHVGKDISIQELKSFYDAIIFCYGAEGEKHLGIKGENLKGIYTANQFVGWYNGHPEHQNGLFDFSHEVAVIMGLGNVALDIARILCSTPAALAKTDISKQALDALSESRIKEVHMYGRRCAAYAAFTPPELAEMGQLSECCCVVDPQDLLLDPDSLKVLQAEPFRQKNFNILKSYVNVDCGTRTKKFFLHFNRSPVEMIGQPHLEKVKFGINKEGKPTGLYEEIHCGLFFTSIGYCGVGLEGLPFLQEEGIIANTKGRILEGDKFMKGLYACGWIASGATGVIGTNKLRAQETVASLIEDIPNLPPCKMSDSKDLINLLKSRGIWPITFIDWKKIDAYEVQWGLKSGKPREKLTSVAQMLAVARGESVS